jgi:hypothetical protein
MSSTRKIEGFIDAPPMDPPDSHTGLICTVVNAPFQDAEVVIPVTVIIGGNGYTVDEHEAEFQRTREVVQALVNALADPHKMSLAAHALDLAKSQLQIEPTKP